MNKTRSALGILMLVLLSAMSSKAADAVETNGSAADWPSNAWTNAFIETAIATNDSVVWFGSNLFNYATNGIQSNSVPIPSDYQIDKAKGIWREAHPECAVCGYVPDKDQDGNQVHHIVPVHVDRRKAANQDNFVTLCHRHHWWIGHCGTGFMTYNTNVIGTVEALRTAFSNSVRSTR